MKPTAETVRALLICDAATGKLIWRARTPEMFAGPRAEWRCKKWNGRYAGREAGHVAKIGKLKGRRQVRIFYRAYLAHQVIWLIVHGEWPSAIDHRDGIAAGDGLGNLRIATQSQNMQNSKKRSNNKSGFKGVSWDSFTQRWVVRIRHPHGGKFENLGRFDDPADGHQAYRKRAVELYGEFARFE